MDDESLFAVKGRVACVTGASSGIGRAAASRLAAAGARVVGVARRESELKPWAAANGGEKAFVVADLADRSRLADVATAITQPFGAPDILVNAAGINTRQHADDVTHEGWNKTFDLNLAAPFFLAQGLVPAMKKRRWGRIVNFASLQSAFGIMVNALAPGFFPTALTGPVFADPALAARNAAQTCIGRNGELSDLDGPLLFFCSDACAYVTGQTLFVDGGFTAK